jgi:hypothetical protein
LNGWTRLIIKIHDTHAETPKILLIDAEIG